MTYITNNDIEERLGTTVLVQLTDDEGSGTADADKIDEARIGAQGLADSYLARRYAVPVDATGDAELAGLLRSITLDLAEFRLHARRPPVPADVLTRYQQAIAWLERIADGRVRLPSPTELPSPATDGPVCEVIGVPRLFTRDSMERL